ncbi:MAG: MFS transporter [Christensenellaceae bacterium]|jgi:MFS family permease
MEERSRPLKLFMILIALESLAANLAHPVTPTLLQNLAMPNYMFGVAFAGMAITNFLFSPFWGKMSDYFSLHSCMLFCLVGYACGQFLFMMAKTQVTVLLARMVSGMFTGGARVISMIYVVEYTHGKKQGQNLTIMSTLIAVFATFGFLVGGMLGEISINAVFLAQIIMLASIGVGYFLIMRHTKDAKKATIQNARVLIKEANPFSAFFAIKPYLTATLVIFFGATLFANIGLNAYDQCFNYYLKDQFGFSPAYNGVIKAIVGVVSLISNFTICMWILRKTKVLIPTAYVLLGCGISNAVMIFMPTLGLFLGMAILLFACTAIFQPLLQDIASRQSNEKNRGVVLGFFNAMRSLGMVIGALVAGFLYDFGPKLPFWMACAAFLVATGLMFLYAKKKKTA